ncbi:MAG: carbohydrate ABC transporter permease [Firmicutes bacterium]|nr:carbohydrate ABC transporter permease [Bacillota bacterium]
MVVRAVRRIMRIPGMRSENLAYISGGARKQLTPGRVAVFLIITIGAIAMVVPFLWAFTISLKSMSEVYRSVGRQFIPDSWHWENYLLAWRSAHLLRAFMNSLFVTTVSTAGEVLICALAAYALARTHFPGSRFFMVAFLSTLMISFQVIAIPTYIVLRDLRLLDTYGGLIFPGLANGFFIFLLKNYFEEIPHELEEAATMDGSSFVGTFFRIIMPLSAPALATIVIFSFVGHWNAFMLPLLVINDPKRATLQYALQLYMMGGTSDTGNLPPLNEQMAAVIITMAPILILFFTLQRYFMKGLTLGALKQ